MPKKDKQVTVKTISAKGDVALVEWVESGRLKRAVVPAVSVVEGQVDPEVLSMGVPFGLPWEKIIQVKATPVLLADGLRNAGIWTLEDFRAHMPDVQAVIQAVYGVEFATLLWAAQSYTAEVTNGG